MPTGFAPIAIGLGLTLIHLISTSGDKYLGESGTVARTPALFVGGWALAQLWLFWLAPIVGSGTPRWGLPTAGWGRKSRAEGSGGGRTRSSGTGSLSGSGEKLNGST